MIILPFLAAISLASQPATPPERLDPDDIEALTALLEALTRGEDPDEDEAEDGAEATAETPVVEPPAPAPAAPTSEEPTEPAEAVEPDATDSDAVDGDEPPEELNDEAEPEAEVEAEAGHPAATAIDEAALESSITAMGPHVGAADYEEVRGTRLGAGTRTTWSVSVRPLDAEGAVFVDDEDAGDGASATERRFIAGNGWAGDETEAGFTLNDFTARRQLRVNTDAGTFTNSSLYALARRNLDIYIFLSEGGQRETIEFGPGTSFDRFWLEAAMGVAASPAALSSTQTTGDDDSTVVTWLREGSDRVIASVRYGSCDSLDGRTSRFLLAGLGHKLALHPGLINALHERGEVPCAFSFVIISPDSPQGRIEHWTREGVEPASIDLSSYGALALTMPEADLLDAAMMDVAVAAAQGRSGDAPAAPEFLAGIQELRSRGDYAGAYLLLAQEAAHFGPCPAETIGSERIACTSITSIIQSGLGNAALERAMEATDAVNDGAHRTAIENLRGFTSRLDGAGAAARTILANELLSMGPEGLAEYAHIDPVAFLEQALVIDPFAPDGYWHLGRRYLEVGAPEAAWTLFDLGRALPGREPTPLLRQATRVEESLLQLAPRLFGPPAQ